MHLLKAALSTSLLLGPSALLAADVTATPLEELFISEPVCPLEQSEWKLSVSAEYEDSNEANNFSFQLALRFPR